MRSKSASGKSTSPTQAQITPPAINDWTGRFPPLDGLLQPQVAPAAPLRTHSLDWKHLQDLVAVMVDDFDGDLAG